MLATVVGLKLFGGVADGHERRPQVLVGADTDNQSNPYASAKILNATFPLNVVDVDGTIRHLHKYSKDPAGRKCPGGCPHQSGL